MRTLLAALALGLLFAEPADARPSKPAVELRATAEPGTSFASVAGS